MPIRVNSCSKYIRAFCAFCVKLIRVQCYIKGMTNKNRAILNQIRHVARQNVPQGSLVLLFGSRARGEERKGSDWDILIVLPKDQLRQEDYDLVSYPLVELGWTLGEQINPIVYTRREWEASSITPFYDNVQRDGVSLL